MALSFCVPVRNTTYIFTPPKHALIHTTQITNTTQFTPITFDTQTLLN